MTQPANHPPSAVTILLVMTAVTGIVDAVSFLTLGHVFTANMTGNVVFLGFALGGAPGVSIPRSLLALVCFLMGALLGGRITTQMTAHESGRGVFRVSVIETLLLLAAATIALGLSVPYEDHPGKIQGVIALTAIAMGLRNAMVRKLNVPDLTTTVLTLTLTGLAADSTLADGKNPRWRSLTRFCRGCSQGTASAGSVRCLLSAGSSEFP